MDFDLVIDLFYPSCICPPNHGRHQQADDGDDPKGGNVTWPGWADFFYGFVVFDHEGKGDRRSAVSPKKGRGQMWVQINSALPPAPQRGK